MTTRMQIKAYICDEGPEDEMPLPSPFSFKYRAALEKYLAMYFIKNDTNRSAWVMLLGITPNATAVIEAAMYPVGKHTLIQNIKSCQTGYLPSLSSQSLWSFFARCLASAESRPTWPYYSLKIDSTPPKSNATSRISTTIVCLRTQKGLIRGSVRSVFAPSRIQTSWRWLIAGMCFTQAAYQVGFKLTK